MLACGGASLEELLTLRGPVPRGLLSVGIVIDDLVLLEKVLSSSLAADPKPSTLSSARLEKIEKAYLESNLPTNQKKAFDDSVTGSFWGFRSMAARAWCGPMRQEVGPWCSPRSEFVVWAYALLAC